MSSPTIPPGGEGKIKVTIHTRGRKGRLNKSITVFSNDPKTPRFMLKMQGEVDVLLSFAPERLNLGRVGKNATVERTVRLDGKLADKAKLSEPKANSELVKAVVTKDDSGRQALKLTIQPGSKEQRFTSAVRVKTGLAEPKELSLFVWGVVTADVYAERSYLFFRQFKKTAPVPRSTTLLKSISGKPFKVRKVVDPAGIVKGKVETKGKFPRLVLTLTKEPTKQQTRGKVLLHLDRKDQRVLEVKYGVRQSFSFSSRRGGMRMVRGRVLKRRSKAALAREKAAEERAAKAKAKAEAKAKM